MDTPQAETMFDDQLAAAGAAVEQCANMSAFAHFLLYKAQQAARDAEIPESDPRYAGVTELLEIWDEKIAPGHQLAAQRDPTGPQGAALTRPWRDRAFARA